MTRTQRTLGAILLAAGAVSCSSDGTAPQAASCSEETSSVDATISVGSSVTFNWTPGLSGGTRSHQTRGFGARCLVDRHLPVEYGCHGPGHESEFLAADRASKRDRQRPFAAGSAAASAAT
jgi:hypothetical protein